MLGTFLFLVGMKLKMPTLLGLLFGGLGAVIGYFFGSYVIVSGIVLACLSALALFVGFLYWLYYTLT